ncbi:Myb-like domain-containing protein [Durusdinium trenchii]|uniref:Myb-like domain-containing protein n=1 Tax=Durusdinium trenchii TaxID=1381693 RepID=A0ABP0M9J9_9DINO
MNPAPAGDAADAPSDAAPKRSKRSKEKRKLKKGAAPTRPLHLGPATPGADEEVDVRTYFRSLRRRCGVPTSELPRFFEPVIPCNAEARRRWCFNARHLQALNVRSDWTSSEVQRLQRVCSRWCLKAILVRWCRVFLSNPPPGFLRAFKTAIHAELLENKFQEEYQAPAASLDAKGRQELFASVAARLDGRRLRELLPERPEWMDWMNISNKMQAMSNEEDVPCISPANCLIQYLHHVVHKSHAPTTEVEEEAMKRARAQHGGSLYLNQIADCTGKPLEGSWRCFASHMLSEAEASDLPWSPKELERLREACEECDVGDWMMVASRLGNTCPEECEAQWRRLQTADGEAPTTTRADNVGGAEEKGGSCGLLQSAGSEDVKRRQERGWQAARQLGVTLGGRAGLGFSRQEDVTRRHITDNFEFR